MPAKCPCIEFEGKRFTEIGRRSELLETGMEVKCDVAQWKGSMRMLLRANFQCIALESKCLVEVIYYTLQLKPGIEEI